MPRPPARNRTPLRRRTRAVPPVRRRAPEPPPEATEKPELDEGLVEASGLPRAVVYARVSSKDQEKEGFSIPAQLRLLREYAESNGFAVVEEFVDVETARKAGRTNFGKMMAWLKADPTCRTLLVEKTDRLYRNLKDWVTLDGMADLDIHLVKEGTVLSEGSRSSEKFIHGIKVLMAKNYIDNLSEEARKGMQEKVEQGIWPARAPLGYRNVTREDGKKVIEPDPELGPLVTRLFELYATGRYSLKDITKQAFAEGLTRRGSGKPLPKATVHHMLTNPMYMGQFDWHGIRYNGIHYPLVSRILWDQVQEMLQDRGTCCRRPKKHDFTFSGLVWCERCAAEGENRLLVGVLVKKKYIYYHCTRCAQLGRAKYIKERDIDAAVTTALQTLRLDREVVAWVTRALRESHNLEARYHEESIARLQAQYAKLQARIDAAYGEKLDGAITSADFDRLASDWRNQQGLVRGEMALHESADQSYMEQGVSLLELAGRALEIYERQDGEEKRRLLDFLFLNSLWGDQGLTVNWRKPFDILANHAESANAETPQNKRPGAKSGSWLPLLDLNQRHPD